MRSTLGGVHAVDDLSLSFEKGKITSIIGPNGSGKSTFVNVLTGIYPMDGGLIVVGGELFRKVSSPELAALGITRTFQEVRLFNQMTVLDNILVILTERGVFPALAAKHTKFHLSQVKEILKKVGLWEKRNEIAANCSYGQRKLLEIARVLAMNSEVLLLDEPFAGLFPEIVKLVVSLLEEFRAAGKTVVLIEHNMELVRKLSDHVFVMDGGKLLAEGKPEEVLRAREVIEAYLGE
ncbi:MAG: ABC transporter ATP-binding protein [Minisyncoccia bacterium]